MIFRDFATRLNYSNVLHELYVTLGLQLSFVSLLAPAVALVGLIEVRVGAGLSAGASIVKVCAAKMPPADYMVIYVGLFEA